MSQRHAGSELDQRIQDAENGRIKNNQGLL